MIHYDIFNFATYSSKRKSSRRLVALYNIFSFEMNDPLLKITISELSFLGSQNAFSEIDFNNK